MTQIKLSNQGTTIEITEKELATIRASLSLFRANYASDVELEALLQDHFLDEDPLSEAEMDALCEKLPVATTTQPLNISALEIGVHVPEYVNATESEIRQELIEDFPQWLRPGNLGVYKECSFWVKKKSPNKTV